MGVLSPRGPPFAAAAGGDRHRARRLLDPPRKLDCCGRRSQLRRLRLQQRFRGDLHRRARIGVWGALDLAVSSNGNSLYVSALGSDAVAHFFAAPQGQITYGGCVSDEAPAARARTSPAVRSPRRRGLPPAQTGTRCSRRDRRRSAILRRPQGQITFGGCVSNNGSGGDCTDVPGSAFSSPSSVAVSADSNSVYVSAPAPTASATSSPRPRARSPSEAASATTEPRRLHRCARSRFPRPWRHRGEPGRRLHLRGRSWRREQRQSLLRRAPGPDHLRRLRQRDRGRRLVPRRPGSGFKLPQDLAVRPDGASVYAARAPLTASATSSLRPRASSPSGAASPRRAPTAAPTSRAPRSTARSRSRSAPTASRCTPSTSGAPA